MTTTDVRFVTTWDIKKTGEDNYHVHGGDQFTRIEEDVDGSKLMGMLASKGLSDSQIGDILSSLDAHEVGYETTITFKPPKSNRSRTSMTNLSDAKAKLTPKLLNEVFECIRTLQSRGQKVTLDAIEIMMKEHGVSDRDLIEAATEELEAQERIAARPLFP
jgi:hypothetical protein